MGRSSSFILNKSGKTIFWSSVWSNQFNYSNFLNKTYFIESFMSFMSNNKKYKNPIFILKKLKYRNVKRFNYFYNILAKKNTKILIKKAVLVETAEMKLNRLKKEKIKFTNFSKFWIIKHQSWLIITFFVLVNKILKSGRRKKKKKSYLIPKKKISKVNFI